MIHDYISVKFCKIHVLRSEIGRRIPSTPLNFTRVQMEVMRKVERCNAGRKEFDLSDHASAI